MEILLADNGHEVMLEAGSFEEALENVKKAKELGVNIAILDGDLGTGYQDGQKIAELLKKEMPGIKIISFSGLPADWGDVNPDKEVGPKRLLEIIAEL